MTNKTTKTKKKEDKKTEIQVVDTYSLSGKKVDKFKLDPDVFSAKINKSLMHQATVMHLANKRQGNASTKKRGEVSGGGKKPWKQKGTGRARAGSIRSPLWRGGGVVFGPQPRDFGFSIPKKMKRLSVISSLSAKTKDKEIVVLEKGPELKQPKTKDIAKTLKALKVYSKSVLFIYSKKDENLVRSCRNIQGLSTRLCSDFNTYDVLSSSKVLFSKDTHECIVKRLKVK
ncbi:MAG: 50S ribosomal protein L4 [Candidatus Omnitrophica bacterium]|nr:50S ribosomal protein L4 [Candidatus Omnitrophota bacterium]